MGRWWRCHVPPPVAPTTRRGWKRGRRLHSQDGAKNLQIDALLSSSSPPPEMMTTSYTPWWTTRRTSSGSGCGWRTVDLIVRDVGSSSLNGGGQTKWLSDFTKSMRRPNLITTRSSILVVRVMMMLLCKSTNNNRTLGQGVTRWWDWRSAVRCAFGNCCKREDLFRKIIQVACDK